MPKIKTKSEIFYKHALKVLRHGYIDPETNKRMGKFADGFEASDGFDLRKFNSWSPAQKGKITRLFKTIDKLTSRPFQVYRTTNKKNLRKVQQAAQHDEFPKNLKVAFVPSSSQKEKVKIRITRKGNVKFKQGSVSRDVIDFSSYGYTPEDLALDPGGVVEDVAKQVPANRYKIQGGEHEVNQGRSIGRMGSSFPLEKLKEAVRKMVNYYSAERFDADNKNSSYFGNWLFGVVGYNFDEYSDYRQYQAVYNRARQATQKKRASLRQQLKRRIAKEKAAKRRGKK